VEEVGGLAGLANALEQQVQRRDSSGGGSGDTASAAAAVHLVQRCLEALDHPLYRNRVVADLVAQRWLLVSPYRPLSSSSSSAAATAAAASSPTDVDGGSPGLNDMGVGGMEMDVDTSIPDPPAFVLLALHSAADASAHGYHRLALRMCVEVYQLLMDTLDLESLTVAQRANPLIAHVEGSGAAAEPAATASAAAAAAAAQRAVHYNDHREDEGECEEDGYDGDYEFDNYDDDDYGSGDGGHGEGGGAGRRR
jgi:hypothetical protein